MSPRDMGAPRDEVILSRDTCTSTLRVTQTGEFAKGVCVTG